MGRLLAVAVLATLVGCEAEGLDDAPVVDEEAAEQVGLRNLVPYSSTLGCEPIDAISWSCQGVDVAAFRAFVTVDGEKVDTGTIQWQACADGDVWTAVADCDDGLAQWTWATIEAALTRRLSVPLAEDEPRGLRFVYRARPNGRRFASNAVDVYLQP